MERTKEAGRLSALRKYIPTPEDAEMVKEMIADGLSDEDILHALGFVSGAPAGALPNGHKFSNKKTTEQEEKEEQAAGLGQPGVGGSGDGSEGDAGGDMLTHLAGLLGHITKQPKAGGSKKP